MGAYLKMLFLVVLVYALSGAALQYEVKDNTGGKCSYSSEKVQLIVNDVLSTELNTNPYLRGIIKIFPTQDGMQNYFVVTLLRSDMYLAKIYRINLEQSVVTTVIEDYVEVEVEPQDSRACSVCPNPNVEAVMSWILDFTTSVSNGRKCVQAMRDGGLVADTLPGSKETLANIKNYLKCPKLKMWIRIGHGSTSGIQLGGGGSFNSSVVSGIQADMKNKIFIFNSCSSHNPPFETAMINAGVYFYASGDVSLVTNKEQVTTFFVNHAVKNKEQLDAAMDAATKEASYPNAWGKSGAAPKPWLFANAGPGTSISDHSAEVTIHKYNFYVTVTPEKVLFLNSGSSDISIYTLTGKLVFKKTGLTEWDKTSFSGQKVNAGSYIAIATCGSKIIKQPFTILK